MPRPFEWSEHVASTGESKGVYRVLVGKYEGKRPLGRPRRSCEDNVRKWDVGVMTGSSWLKIGTSLDFVNGTLLSEEYRSLNSSLRVFNFLHSIVTSSLLGPNSLLSTLFSDNLSLSSSLNVSDQVSHPYKKGLNYSSVYQVQVWGFMSEYFVTKYLFKVRSCQHLNLKAGGLPSFSCPQLLMHYISSYRPYWRPLLHPQPEDAPCRGDRDPLFTASLSTCIWRTGTLV